MTWLYDVKKKSFYRNGVFMFYALYAGASGYKNDSQYECVVNKGPLPRGKYRIIGAPFTHEIAGRFTLRLHPYATNNMCGRGGFLIHGDSIAHPGEASNGCIVAAPAYRRTIWESGDKEVLVR
ncbi:tlde1 domain-containing protein [Cedecea davisae]|uniref:tlde1 domain-containing protein n=1 Tax=Cedecea davisae TaxID=158484 RepID=UPI00376EECC6